MDQDDFDDHSHCKTCHRANCGTKPPVKSHCPVIPCKLRCGARFHACKQEDHKEACELEKVECINSVSGCPLIIQRNKLGVHLERCPASVVYCTMEWNRWPVYSHERQSRVPFVGDNLHAQYGQLDVALALRDQRMLNQAMKAPRSTRRALRNNLTQRFPAVPIRLNSNNSDSITSGSSSRTDSNEDIDARKNIEYPPGLERSICNALFKATRNAVESLTTPTKRDAESLVGSSAVFTVKTEAEGGIDSGEELGADIDNSVKYCHASEPSDNRHDGDNQKEEQPETVANDNLLTGGMLPSHTGEEVDNINETQGTDHTPATVMGGGTIPEPPCLAPLNPIRETLALDLNLESITRYQAKPKSMYTFLCAQEFRRDEYASHFKNVHDVIHSGLNGWLEQRCPLAHYGCTYSLRRLYAGEKGAEIVHNDILDSFGVKPYLPPHQRDIKPTLDPLDIVLDTSKSTLPPKYLTSTEDFCDMECNGNFDDSSNMILNDKNKMKQPEGDSPPKDFSALPFEVVRQIAVYLDSYSLCNLALTNRLLREVACSLLEEKGIVIQQWEKRVINGRPSWDISHKRWIYSTAFTDIKKWGYEDYLPLGDHLKVCPFYHRAQAAAPHHLPSIKCGHHHSDNFCDIMRRMYPDFTLHRDGEEPACTASAGLC